MGLKKQKGKRNETMTLRSKLSRNGFNLAETNKLFSECTLYFLMAMNEDPSHVGLSFKKAKDGSPAVLGSLEYYERKLVTGDGCNFPFDIPVILRRAALNKADGMYRSWLGNYRRWEAQEDKRKVRLEKIALQTKGRKLKPFKPTKPPVLPTEIRCNAPYYKGMFKDDTGESIMLKILIDGAWKWIKFNYAARPDIPGWSKATGTLVIDRTGQPWFNWVYEIQHEATGGLKALMSVGSRFVAVDTDLDGEIAKMAAYQIADEDGGCEELAFSLSTGHAAHTARRKSRLGKQAIRMKKTGGVMPEGFGSKHWSKIRRCEKEATAQVSSQIIQFALKHGCTAICFEFLGRLRPCKGRFSRRSNQKRAYWLKSAVFNETERKARVHHNIITGRVNPRDTSNTEALMGEAVKRTGSMNVAMLWKANPKLWEAAKYHPGANAVAKSGKIINSGLNACRRIALKFVARFYSKAHIEIGGCAGVVYHQPAKR